MLLITVSPRRISLLDFLVAMLFFFIDDKWLLSPPLVAAQKSITARFREEGCTMYEFIGLALWVIITKNRGCCESSEIASERTDLDNSTEPQWTRIMKSQMPGVPGRGAGCFEDNGRWKWPLGERRSRRGAHRSPWVIALIWKGTIIYNGYSLWSKYEQIWSTNLRDKTKIPNWDS